MIQNILNIKIKIKKKLQKLYMISNLNICAEIINEKVMNNLTHYNIIIHRGTSKSRSCLSRIALETFYQSSQIKKKPFFYC